MIVGLENLIIFCHFEEDDGDVFVYMNHDDVEAEEFEVNAENQRRKIYAVMNENYNPLDNSRIFASLNGQQVANSNQLNINSHFDHIQSTPPATLSPNFRPLQSGFAQPAETTTDETPMQWTIWSILFSIFFSAKHLNITLY